MSTVAELEARVSKLQAQVDKMYTPQEYDAYGEDYYNRGHAEGYREATNDCEDFFQSRMYNLRDYIQKLNLTSTQLG
tara:strand:- start:159 stop:389 length:231 start_codon:yes stop_codon:yes gene_type:complete